MIYDCFLFFNELELLELRLHELADVVDRFVLVEATTTFSNKPKPLHYAENCACFERFADRIIHVVVPDSPDTSNAWAIEDFQRNCLARGLKFCAPDDLILMSDVDEIPRASAVKKAAKEMRFNQNFAANLGHKFLSRRAVFRLSRRWLRRRHPFVRVFEQTPHAYFLNCVATQPKVWHGTRMCHLRDLTTPVDMRRWMGDAVPNGGWHFTHMGGVAAMQEKIAAYSHQEWNKPEYTSAERLGDLVEQGKDIFGRGGEYRFVQLDDTYPQFLMSNLDQYQDWIREPGA